jgi:hypothetical protein
MPNQIFEYFPKVDYTVDGSVYNSATDITRSFTFSDLTTSYISDFYDYTIKDSDSLLILTDKVYEDENLDWFISLANKWQHPLFDFPYNSFDADSILSESYSGWVVYCSNFDAMENSYDVGDSITITTSGGTVWYGTVQKYDPSYMSITITEDLYKIDGSDEVKFTVSNVASLIGEDVVNTTTENTASTPFTINKMVQEVYSIHHFVSGSSTISPLTSLGESTYIQNFITGSGLVTSSSQVLLGEHEKSLNDKKRDIDVPMVEYRSDIISAITTKFE